MSELGEFDHDNQDDAESTRQWKAFHEIKRNHFPRLPWHLKWLQQTGVPYVIWLGLGTHSARLNM